MTFVPFRRLDEAKLQVFAVPVAAGWGSEEYSSSCTLGHSLQYYPLSVQWCSLCFLLHVWQLLLHAFCVWLAAFGDRMLDPSIFTLPITVYSCPPGKSVFFFLLPFRRGECSWLDLFDLLLAHGLFLSRTSGLLLHKFQTFKQLIFLEAPQNRMYKVRICIEYA